jgi:hypothetical protein
MPRLPTLNPELTKTEHIPPIGHPETGQMVQVDKGWLTAATDLTAWLIQAVQRGNNRAAGVKLERRCTATLYETGKVPADCPKQ